MGAFRWSWLSDVLSCKLSEEPGIFYAINSTLPSDSEVHSLGSNLYISLGFGKKSPCSEQPICVLLLARWRRSKADNIHRYRNQTKRADYMQIWTDSRLASQDSWQAWEDRHMPDQHKQEQINYFYPAMVTFPFSLLSLPSTTIHLTSKEENSGKNTTITTTTQSQE